MCVGPVCDHGSGCMRKLAIAAFAFSAAVFAANYIFSRLSVIYAAVFCAFIGAAVLGIRLKSLKGVVIAFFAAAVGFVSFAAHYDLTTEKAHSLSGSTESVRFVLIASPQEYETYTSAEVRLEREGLPRLKCIFYDSEKELGRYSCGDVLTAKVKLSAADVRYGARTDRYTAKDVYLTGNVKGMILKIGHKSSLVSLASSVSGAISRRVDSIFPADTAPFIKALLVGNKSDIYRDDALYVSLSRAGLMHVVAVSGMHVSFLVAFLRFILGKGRRSAILCIALVWLFVIISGLSPSAVRAAFMQTMLLIAPLVGRENDSVTSLSAALAFLLLLNPFAAGNISLQLSFSAMLGIILFADRIVETLMKPFGEGRLAQGMKYPIGLIGMSLSVMVFSLPVTAIHFGYVSAVSPLTNLLCLWAIPICFIGGYVCCLLSLIPAIGQAAALGISLLVRYCFRVCGALASLRYSAIYLSGWASVLWIIALYVSLVLVFLFKCKTHWKIVIPTATAILGVFLTQLGIGWYYDAARGTVAAIDVGQGQCISAFAGESTVLIDCGSISYSEYNAGDAATAYLRSRGREKIDYLVLTHLHDDHTNGFERLTNLMQVDTLVLPRSAAADEAFFELLQTANQHGTKIRIAKAGDLIVLNGMLLRFFDAENDGDQNERCMPVVVSIGDYDMIVTGDAPQEREKKLIEEFDLALVDVLVVGHHGSKNASCEEYLSAIGGDRALISVGKNNYGLPSTEILERLERFGYTVSRTDTDGTVEIRVHG